MEDKIAGEMQVEVQNNTSVNFHEERKESSSNLSRTTNRPVKHHGFVKPFHPYQVFSWILFAFNLIVFYILVIISLSEYVALVATTAIIFFVLNLTVAYYAVKCGGTDPTDPTVRLEKESRLKGVLFNPDEYNYFCSICTTHVKDKSKHCGDCNRCVDGFDHHCKWLNNCVGEQNYADFIKLIIAVTVYCVFNIICYSLFFFYYAHNRSDMEVTQVKVLGKSAMVTFFVIIIIFFVIDAAFLLLSIQLIGLHSWLRSKGMTTYEYIVYKRELEEENEEKTREKIEEKKNRKRVIQKIEKNKGGDKRGMKIPGTENLENLKELTKIDSEETSKRESLKFSSREFLHQGTNLSNARLIKNEKGELVVQEDENEQNSSSQVYPKKKGAVTAFFSSCFGKKSRAQNDKTRHEEQSVELQKIEENDQRTNFVPKNDVQSIKEMIEAVSGCTVDPGTVKEPREVDVETGNDYSINQSVEIKSIISKSIRDENLFRPQAESYSFGLNKKPSSSKVLTVQKKLPLSSDSKPPASRTLYTGPEINKYSATVDLGTIKELTPQNKDLGYKGLESKASPYFDVDKENKRREDKQPQSFEIDPDNDRWAYRVDPSPKNLQSESDSAKKRYELGKRSLSQSKVDDKKQKDAFQENMSRADKWKGSKTPAMDYFQSDPQNRFSSYVSTTDKKENQDHI